MTNGKLTPTLRRMLEVLDDGEAHLCEDLQKLIGDELAGPGTLRCYMSRLRLYLRPKGRTVMYELIDNRRYYRQVRFLQSPDDGLS